MVTLFIIASSASIADRALVFAPEDTPKTRAQAVEYADLAGIADAQVVDALKLDIGLDAAGLRFYHPYTG